MVGGALLPVHGPSDIHAAGHGVDAEDLHGGLVGTDSRDAVPDGDVVVFVGADLEGGVAGGWASACPGGGHAPTLTLTRPPFFKHLGPQLMLHPLWEPKGEPVMQGLLSAAR